MKIFMNLKTIGAKMDNLIYSLAVIAIKIFIIILLFFFYLFVFMFVLSSILYIVVGVVYGIKFVYKKIFNKKKKNDEIVCTMHYLLHKGLAMDFIKRQEKESEKEYKKRLQMLLDIVSEAENEY